MEQKAEHRKIEWHNLNWVLAVVIIIVGSLGLQEIFNVSECSAFILCSGVAFLYLIGVNR